MDCPVSMAVELATARMMRVTVGRLSRFMLISVGVFIEARDIVYHSLYSLAGIKPCFINDLPYFDNSSEAS